MATKRLKKRKKLLRLLCLFVANSFAAENEPPFEVVESRPLPSLTKIFQQSDGWTGADDAYSIPLGRDRTLWVFADTWIGKIENGKRTNSRMVNNSFAWQSLKRRDEPLQFFWQGDANVPASVLQPVEPKTWYWPGDGAVVDGKLYLVCKVVRRSGGKVPGWNFDWFGDELLQIQNPLDPPTDWKFERAKLLGGANDLRLSVACLVDGSFLYAYGLFPAEASNGLDRPLGVARLSLRKLRTLDMSDWEFFCRDGWQKKPDQPAALFRDAAPEMTVSRVRGIKGFVATYTAIGLSRDIMVRHALRPEGPWSKPLRVYHCPEEKLMLYAAKAHPELATKDGQLIITYCRNAGSLKEHVEHPEIYFPQGVEVQLRAARRK